MRTPAPYPRELEERIVLPNQRRLRIRPLRRHDAGPVRELFGRLSPHTRYLRFFSPMPELSDPLLRRLTSVDYRRRLALVAELETAGGTEVVALGSYGAIDDTSVEVGLVVCDAWQRQGIGMALAVRVMRAAEARGHERFVAHALWDNLVIRKILARLGEIVSTKVSYGVCEVSFVPRRAVHAAS